MQVAVYVSTVLLSSVIANNAAAALMYPIAVSVAAQQVFFPPLAPGLLWLDSDTC
jgi:di/tricarboxylate transporter